jgi:hypothetical protein
MASMAFMRPSIMRQQVPGAPTFTEKDLNDLSGKVSLMPRLQISTTSLAY